MKIHLCGKVSKAYGIELKVHIPQVMFMFIWRELSRMVLRFALFGVLFVAVPLTVFVITLYISYMKRLPKPTYRNREERPDIASWEEENVTLTWIGHSTVLMKVFDKYILTDPIFVNRIGVRMAGIKIGPHRYTEPAVYPHEMPPIDVVLLSHAHMDHLDIQSLKRVVTDQTTVVTARNTTRLLRRMKPKKVVELMSPDQVALEDNLRIHAIPARHWGNRYPWNKNYGWTGYIVEYKGVRILFAGDTAFLDTFAQVPLRYGEISLALFPIGAYKPDSYQTAHCTPEQAWRMFLDSGATWFVPIHWNTFVLSQESITEPMERLLNVAGNHANRIVIHKQGQTFIVPPQL